MTPNPNDVARRARIASIGFLSIFLFLGIAFFRVQIVQHDLYALQSQQNRLRPVPIPAPRGIIYDRNGEIIAESISGFTVSLLSQSTDSLRTMLARFSELVPLDSALIRRVSSEKTFSRNRPTLILSDATFEQVSLLMEHKADIPGLQIQSAPKRFYPDGRAVASFVGYTREISEGMLELDRYSGYKPGQQVGALGLEDEYEERLRGREGTRFLEVNSGERVVRENAGPPIPAQSGEAIYTNIDMKLQRFIADSVFSDTLKGAIVVMETVSGAVLAIHSSPSYDPNDFIGRLSAATFDSLNTDPRLPLFNRALKGRYPPASTFKLVTAILGLQEGLVNFDSHMPAPCDGGYRLGTRVFHCWKKEGHGSLSLAEAIAQSCNVYFFQLGRQLGFARLLGGGVNLGLAARSGIDLPEEMPAFVPPDEAYFRSRYGNDWSREAVVLNASIGQGEVNQSVLSLARFYSAIATDGQGPEPQILKGISPQRSPLITLDPDQLSGVRDALKSVVSSAGTAGSASIKGLVLAGKTGTAQNSFGKDHGWFVGFAPADRPNPGERPQILVAVVIEHGEHGSVAARSASKVLSYHFKQDVQVKETGG